MNKERSRANWDIVPRTFVLSLGNSIVLILTQISLGRRLSLFHFYINVNLSPIQLSYIVSKLSWFDGRHQRLWYAMLIFSFLKYDPQVDRMTFLTQCRLPRQHAIWCCTMFNQSSIYIYCRVSRGPRLPRSGNHNSQRGRGRPRRRWRCDLDSY